MVGVEVILIPLGGVKGDGTVTHLLFQARHPFKFLVKSGGFGLVRILHPGGLHQKQFPQGAENDQGGQQHLVPCADMDAGSGPETAPQQCQQGKRARVPDAALFQQPFRPDQVPVFPPCFSGGKAGNQVLLEDGENVLVEDLNQDGAEKPAQRQNPQGHEDFLPDGSCRFLREGVELPRR